MVVYNGGTITAPLGVISLFFPTSRLRWTPPTGLTLTGRRRKYGSRQRSNAAAGEAFKVRFNDGEVVTVRVTGTHRRFLDEIIASSAGDNIRQVWSERGTIYGPQFIDE